MFSLLSAIRVLRLNINLLGFSVASQYAIYLSLLLVRKKPLRKKGGFFKKVDGTKGEGFLEMSHEHQTNSTIHFIIL